MQTFDQGTKSKRVTYLRPSQYILHSILELSRHDSLKSDRRIRSDAFWKIFAVENFRNLPENFTIGKKEFEVKGFF